MTWMTHPQAPWHVQSQPSRSKSAWWSNFRKSLPLAKTVGILLSLISLWNIAPCTPLTKTDQPILCGPLAFWDGVCFFLNKSTSYLLLCLSLNSFCYKTSRTSASLSLIQGAWSQLKNSKFKSQSELVSLLLIYQQTQVCKNFSLKILKRSPQRYHKFTKYKSFQFNSPDLTNIEIGRKKYKYKKHN